MTYDPTNSGDQRRWEEFSRRSPIGSCPDLLDLAGWVDGRLEPARRTAIESHLAACSDCRQATALLRLVPDVEPAVAEADLASIVDRAQQLVRPGPVIATIRGFGALVPGRDGGRPASWSRPSARVGRWTAAAAASVVVCLLGYQAGTISAPPVVTQGDVLDDITFGVLDGTTAESWDMLTLAGQEVTG